MKYMIYSGSKLAGSLENNGTPSFIKLKLSTTKNPSVIFEIIKQYLEELDFSFKCVPKNMRGNRNISSYYSNKRFKQGVVRR